MASQHVNEYKAMATLGALLGELDKEIGWQCRLTLIGMTLRLKDGEWLLVLRAMRNGTNYVSFLSAHSLMEVYRSLWVRLHKDRLNWRVDKFNPKG